MSDVVILVDVQNVYYTTMSAHGCHFDYRRFWRRVSDSHQIKRAIAYAIDRDDSRQKKFQSILRDIGFEVKLKPYIQRVDGSAKGDWDVGITLDAVRCAPMVDKIILLSGDGDFDLLATAVRAQFNVDFDVYGVESLTARALIEAATSFTAIDGELLLRVNSRT